MPSQATVGLVHRGLSLTSDTSSSPVTRLPPVLLPSEEKQRHGRLQDQDQKNKRQPAVDLALLHEWLQDENGASLFASQWAMASDCSAVSSKLPCLLCERHRSGFYCRTCLCAGSFSHSDLRHADRDLFVEKRAAWKETTARMEELRHQVLAMNKAINVAAELSESIKQAKQRVKYLQRTSADRQEKLAKTKILVQRVAKANAERRQRRPIFMDKVRRIGRMSTQHRAGLEKREVENETFFDDKLAWLRRKRVSEFAKNIFLLVEVWPSAEEEDHQEEPDAELSSGEDEVKIAETLRDAIQTTFINGHWVKASAMAPATTRAEEPHMSIVAPALPSSGNYSFRNAWKNSAWSSSSPSMSSEFVTHNMEPALPVDSSPEKINPAHTVSGIKSFPILIQFFTMASL